MTTPTTNLVPGTGNLFTGPVSQPMHDAVCRLFNQLHQDYGGQYSLTIMVQGRLFACSNLTHGTLVPEVKLKHGSKTPTRHPKSLDGPDSTSRKSVKQSTAPVKRSANRFKRRAT